MIKKNNIQGEVQTFNNFEIYARLTEDSDTIRFEDETSIERMAYLSTGDQIIGKAIPDDVFIKDIDEANHTITVTEPMQITVDETIKVLCRVQFYPKDNSKDFFKYRINEAKNKQATNENIFENFIYKNNIHEISNFRFLPAIDISNFRDTLLTNIQNQSKVRDQFNKMCKYLYLKNGIKLSQPSTLNCEGDLLLDINAYTNYSDNGETYIMSQKTLDYFEEYLDEMSRVSDNTKIGVSINGYTSGVNTDKNILSVFRKTKDYGSGIPYYIKIGTGKLDDSLFIGEDQENNNSEFEKSYYNDASESYYNEQLYSSDDGTVKEAEDTSIHDIDKPLFKAQLSEYEVLNNIKFMSSQTKFTAVQTAVMRRAFEGFKSVIESGKVVSTKYLDTAIFSYDQTHESSFICSFLGELPLGVSLEDIPVPENKSLLNYYVLNNKTSYAFYEQSSNKWVQRNCVFYKNAEPSKINNKHTNEIQFRQNGKCIFVLNDVLCRLNYTQNKYFNEYENAISNENANNSLSLGVTDIVRGSFNSTIILKENLFSSGYKYAEDGLKVDYSQPVEKISLVEDFIYCDDENKVLYTYNGQEKLMISQENNKYFKNIINNIVEFSVEKTFTKNGIIDNYFLKNVEGFNYDSDKMSLKDRILSLEKIKIRNEYKSENEPIMFSNSIHFKPYLRGILCEGDELTLGGDQQFDFIFGYKFKMNPMSYSQKSLELNEQKKIRPYNKNEETQYEDDTLEFGKSSFEEKVIQPPIYVDSEFSDEQKVIEGFEYYKNLLVLEGKVDLKDPTTIMFENKKALNAISNIENGDEVVDIALLDSPSSNNYDKYDVFKDVKFIDYKERVFVVATTNKIYFFNCADINSLGKELKDYSILDLNDELTSIIYDKENTKWIYTLENNGAFAGCYSVKATYSGEGTPFVESPVQEFDQSFNSIDFNEYQFVKPLRTDNEDIIKMTESQNLKFEDDEAVLARDISFKDIDEDLYSQRLIRKGRVELKSEYNIGSLMEGDFIDLEFDILPSSKQSIQISGSSVIGYYVYDKLVGKWRYSNSYLYGLVAKNIISKVHAHVILADKSITTANYLYQNGTAITKDIKEIFDNANEKDSVVGDMAQFLWLLPRPNTNVDECFIVCVRDGEDVNLVRTRTSVDTNIENLTIKDLKVIKGGYLYNKDNLTPHYKNGFYAVYRDKPLVMAYNFEGYEAVLNGDTLFVKSPTMKWVRDGESGNYNPDKPTTDFYWKKAQIPSQKDLSYLLFDNMSIEEAYQLVSDQKDLFVDYLKKFQGKDTTQEALYSWLTGETKLAEGIAGHVITPDEALNNYEDTAYENQLTIYGIKFLMSDKGLYASINPKAREDYVIPQNISIQGGKTVEAMLRRQTYMNYLRDFYEIILGCNRISNVLENGVKSLKLTSTDLIIVTKSNDILTLPLQYTYTRDDIENYNNWEVKSLAPEMEFPSYGKTSETYTTQYGTGSDNDGTITEYHNQMNSTISKVYEITHSFVENNIQIYSGYYQYSSEAINFYAKVVGRENINDRDLSTLRRPFLAYSEDNGKTFKRLDLIDMAGYEYMAEDAEVSSVYRIGNKIRTTITGTKSTDKNDFVITINNTEYSLANTEKIDAHSEDENMSITPENNIYNNFVRAGLINGSVPYAITSDMFLLAVAASTGAIGKIISKDASSITVSPNNTKFITNDESEEVAVLVSISTAASILKPWDHIDYKEKYFTDHNSLKVKFIQSVDSYEDANLLYSKNEVSHLDEVDEFSILPYALDTNKTVYEYDDNGVVETIKNSFNEDVYLFDKQTYMFLLQRNPQNIMQNALSLGDMIKNGISENALIKACKLSDDYVFKGNTYGVDKLFCDDTKDYIKFNFVSFNRENPFVNVSLLLDESKQSEMFATLDGNKCLFYRWPSDFDRDLDDKEVLDIVNTGQQGFISKLKELYNDGITITNEWIHETFKKVQVTLPNGVTFNGVKEISTDVLLTEELKSDFTLSLLYESYEEQKQFYNQKFEIEETDSLKDINDNAIDVICLKQKGYGSTIDISEWDTIQPHVNDSAAFNEKLLKNSIGNFIYLGDENGKAIEMRNGRFDMSKVERHTIQYEDLYSDECHIKVFDKNGKSVLSYRNFYKIAESDLSVYCPQNEVCLKGKKTKNLLCIFRPHYSDVNLSNYERISVSMTSKLYKDEALSEETKLNVFFEDGFIYFEKNEDDIFTNGNIITFEIKDTANGKSLIKSLNLVNEKTLVVSSSQEVFADSYINNISVSFDTKIADISPVDNKNILVSTIDNKNIELKILNYTKENKVYVKTVDEEKTYTINLDIHELSPKLYVSHPQKSDDENEQFSVKVFSKELDVTDMFELSYESDDGENYTVTAKYHNFELTEQFKSVPGTTDILDVENNTFVFTQLVSSADYTVKENCIIDGLKGKYILSQPKYLSFNELISSLERKVYYDEPLAFEYSDDNQITLKAIEGNRMKIDTDLSDKGQFFVMKLLPVQTFYPDTSTMNNKDYFTEVSVNEIDFFGYDRVWINENVFLPPTFEYDGQNYNGNSMSQYSIDTWKNKDNYRVWLSDKFGRFVKPIEVDGRVNYSVIGDELGDCSSEIYQSHEVRINLNELIYKTSYDKYKNKYFEKGIKSNPFLKKFRIKSAYNDGKIEFNSKPFTDIIKRNKLFEENLDGYTLDFNDDSIDYGTSDINFSLYYDESLYSEDDYKYFVGIKYNNVYKSGSSNIINEDSKIDVISNFVIDSTEDPFNEKKDTKVEITEMGVFSKDDVLLAYMTHPKCQYDTKKNYIAYNLLIED